MKLPTATALLSVLAASALADTGGHHTAAPSRYAGEETREVKSLSAEDLEELRRGGGWGLAKPAELNGLPGPAHLLELKDAIPLTDSQVAALQHLFERMRRDAITEGERLIARERAMEQSFRDRTVTDESLRKMLVSIAESRAALRYIHLSTHLSTPTLLTETQIARYNRLRGYDGTACAEAPAGHDPALWRKHVGC